MSLAQCLSTRAPCVRQQRVGRSRRVSVQAAALPQRPMAPAAQPYRPRVLHLMADYLESQAAVNVFERLAGRTAMIAIVAAAGAELLLPANSDTGFFGALAASNAAGQLAAVGLLLLCCSAGYAARTYRPLARRQRRLLEPLLCSLTAGRRSYAGVTQKNVDRGVDYVLEQVFNQPFISKNFLNEDEYI